MPECNKCKTTLKWKQPYKKGERPVGLDGEPHQCGGKKKYDSVDTAVFNYFSSAEKGALYKEKLDNAQAYWLFFFFQPF